MAEFDRSYTAEVQLCLVPFSIYLTLKNVVTLKFRQVHLLKTAAFDTSHTIDSIVTMTTSFIVSEIKRDIGCIHNTVSNIYVLFSQRNQTPGLAGGVNRFCKKTPLFTHSSRASQTDRDRRTDRRTERQTDGQRDRRTEKRSHHRSVLHNAH